jgi:PAS domain S-box-containing protein
LVYATIALIWILASDTLLEALLTGERALAVASRWKGAGFVLVTALLLLAHVRGELFQFHRAALARQASEARFQQLFEQAPVGIVLAPAGQSPVANPALMAMLGQVSPEAAVQAVLGPSPSAAPADSAPPDTGPLGTRLAAITRPDGSVVEFQVTPGTLNLPTGPAQAAFVADVTAARQTRRALRESEAKYQALVEHMPVGIARFDTNGCFLFANGRLAGLLGHPAQAVIGQTARQLLGDLPVVDYFESRISEVFTTGRALATRFEMDESIFDWRLAPERTPDGTVRSVVSSASDVTEQVRAEAQARENEARLRQVLEVLPVGVWLADARGHVTLANQAVRTIWGLGLSGALPPLEQFRAWQADTGQPVAPGDWAIQRALAAGQPVGEERLEIEGFDGSRRSILTWAVPLYDELGEAAGAIGINQDVSARRRAMAALAASEEKFRALAEHVPAAITRYDRALRHLFINTRGAAPAGLAPEAVLGRTARDLLGHRPIVDFWERHLEAVFATGQPRAARYELDGRVFDWRLAPEFDAQGQVASVVGLSLEITSQVAAE